MGKSRLQEVKCKPKVIELMKWRSQCFRTWAVNQFKVMLLFIRLSHLRFDDQRFLKHLLNPILSAMKLSHEMGGVFVLRKVIQGEADTIHPLGPVSPFSTNSLFGRT